MGKDSNGVMAENLYKSTERGLYYFSVEFIIILAQSRPKGRKEIMNNSKIGELIYQLRKEQNLTQQDIASRLNISNKTVSKWENGNGMPDLSNLLELSGLLGVDLEKMLAGDLKKKDLDNGNLRHLGFYVCSECKNIHTSTSESSIFCCGRKLKKLKPQKINKDQDFQQMDNEYYVHFDSPMTKEDYISFVVYKVNDRYLMIKLYPEQSPEVRFPQLRGKGQLYYYSTKDQSFYQVEVPKLK